MKKLAVSLMAGALLVGSTVTPALAHDRYDRRGYNSGSNEYIKKGLIGAGGGAIVGGLISRDGNRTGGAVKGALLGTGAGLGYEFLRQRGTFRNW